MSSGGGVVSFVFAAVELSPGAAATPASPPRHSQAAAPHPCLHRPPPRHPHDVLHFFQQPRPRRLRRDHLIPHAPECDSVGGEERFDDAGDDASSFSWRPRECGGDDGDFLEIQLVRLVPVVLEDRVGEVEVLKVVEVDEELPHDGLRTREKETTPVVLTSTAMVMAEAVASEKLGGVGSKRRWQTPAAGAVGSCIEEEAPLDVGWRPVVSRAAADLTGRVSEAMTAGSRTPCAAASGPKWFSAVARLNVICAEVQHLNTSVIRADMLDLDLRARVSGAN
uniref:Uncharacterized protein n=1 Tax=Oryza nivara TaxID=4536 RepID=A0A0E0J7J8_ORYNI